MPATLASEGIWAAANACGRGPANLCDERRRCRNRLARAIFVVDFVQAVIKEGVRHRDLRTALADMPQVHSRSVVRFSPRASSACEHLEGNDKAECASWAGDMDTAAQRVFVLVENMWAGILAANGEPQRVGGRTVQQFSANAEHAMIQQLGPTNVQRMVTAPEAVQAVSNLGALTSAGEAGNESVVRVLMSAAPLLETVACGVAQERSHECSQGIAEVVDIASRFVMRDYAGGVVSIVGSETLGRILQGVVVKRLSGGAQQATWLRRLMTYLPLLAELAVADSSDGIQSVLDSLSSGVGSWRRKHEGPTISVQGYAGLLGAYELVGGAEDGFGLSPTLSLGLQFATRVGRNFRFILYAPVIDVGNVVAVRLSDEDSDDGLLEVEDLPEITWGQLFSPGLYVGFSAGRSPIDLLVGFNYVPALRRTVGDDASSLSALRFGLTLSVDVTILPLWQR